MPPNEASQTRFVTETALRDGGVGKAHFDRKRRYRYRLSRVWDDTGPVVSWVMLNPSTATAANDDRTFSRVVDFSRRWGFSGVTVVNLFALMATTPGVLARADDPVGRHNDEVIGATVSTASLVVVAWGNHGDLGNRRTGMPRCEEVWTLLVAEQVTPSYLRLTGRGQPGHPLYLPASSTPTPMDRGHFSASSPARIS